MNFKAKGALGIAIVIMMIAGIIMINPAEVKALPLGDLYAHQVFLGGSVILDVYADKVVGDASPTDVDWKYWYDIQVNDDASLYSISVGRLDPRDTKIQYQVDAWSPPTGNTSPTRLSSSSAVVYFLPSGLGLGQDVSDFWIVYDNFIETQKITITAAGSVGTETVQLFYTGYTPVPEPATLLMLGSGMITLWFLSRRKRRI